MAKKEKKTKGEQAPQLTPEQLAAREEGLRILAEAKKKRHQTSAQSIVDQGKKNRAGRKRRLSNNGRDAIAGYLFILPWIIGFACFFAGPLVQSFIYSFSKIDIDPSGNGLVATWVGWDNYRHIFTAGLVDFLEVYQVSLLKLVYNMPIITLMSLFIALILNQKFRGRTVARAIFFMPVIIASGAIIGAITSNMSVVEGARQGNEVASSVFSAGMDYIYSLFSELKISVGTIDFIRKSVDSIFNTVWLSGIQILLFLGALQTIPTSFYEASAIEGASGWVTFWKITFPIVSPYILVNIVYTTVDSFSDKGTGTVLSYINGFAAKIEYGMSSAMAWIYFLSVAIVLGIISAVVSRYVFYMVD